MTLLVSENSEDEVWGCAYQIADKNIQSVTEHLDQRERGGYERVDVLFYPFDDLLNKENPFYLSIYIGHENNPNYSGYEDISTLAKYIVKSAGASGRNIEYLYNLAAAMRRIAPRINDEHLFELEYTVKKIEKICPEIKSAYL